MLHHKRKLVIFSFIKIIEGRQYFLCAHGYPCFRLLVIRLPWFSKPVLVPELGCFIICVRWIPQIQMWCDICLTSLIHCFILADHIQDVLMLINSACTSNCSRGVTFYGQGKFPTTCMLANLTWESLLFLSIASSQLMNRLSFPKDSCSFCE